MLIFTSDQHLDVIPIESIPSSMMKWKESKNNPPYMARFLRSLAPESTTDYARSTKITSTHPLNQESSSEVKCVPAFPLLNNTLTRVGLIRLNYLHVDIATARILTEIMHSMYVGTLQHNYINSASTFLGDF